jgi:hypothetical protein
VKSKYFRFLCGLVKRDRFPNKNGLLKELHEIKFYSLVPNDDNRAEDGKQLREIFCEREGLQPLSLSQLGDCSVLEMLIGLAYRLEDESLDCRWEKSAADWFWILIDNLSMSRYTDSELLQPYNKDDVRTKIGIMLNRTYRSDGEGGLFPLRYPKHNQREVEIWYQMSAYILENYPI